MGNTIITERNAVKEAECWDQGADLISSEAEVVTFTDWDDDKQQVVNTRHYTANFGSLSTNNHVHSDKVRVAHTFWQAREATTSTVYARESASDRIHFGIRNNDDQFRPDQVMELFVNKETAVALANAILEAAKEN